MGTSYDAVCQQCEHRFEVQEGGGFAFHLLHCDKCGKTKSVSFDEVRATAPANDPDSVSPFDIEAVEALAGQCRCRGSFRRDAPPRCPKCKSTDLEADPDGNMINYD